MRKPQLATQICTLFSLCLCLATAVSAQSNKGSIVGTVRDPNDALITGAKATITNAATGEAREVTTGDEGSFVVSNLEPGRYRVLVEATGFQSINFEEVTVETNSRVPLEVKFTTITGGAGTVTITSEAAPLTQSETSIRGDLI